MEDLFNDIVISSPGETRDNTSETSDAEEKHIEKDIEEISIEPVTEHSKSTTDDESAVLEEIEGLSDKYSALAEELRKEGLLEIDGEEVEIKSLDDLKDYFSKTITSRTESKLTDFKSQFSGAKKKFLEIEESFEDDNVAINVAKDLAYYESITTDDLADEEVSKKIYTNYLKAKGFSDDEIESQIEDAEMLDKLEEKATKALPWLTESTKGYVEEQKKEIESRKESVINSQKQIVEKINSTIDNKEYFIKDLPLNKVLRDKIKKSMSEVVHSDKQGRKYTDLGYKQNKNPEEFSIMLNYYNALGLFNQNSKGEFVPDISKIKQLSKTRAVNELDKVLTSKQARTGTNNKSTTSDVLNNISEIFKGLK